MLYTARFYLQLLHMPNQLLVDLMQPCSQPISLAQLGLQANDRPLCTTQSPSKHSFGCSSIAIAIAIAVGGGTAASLCSCGSGTWPLDAALGLVGACCCSLPVWE